MSSRSLARRTKAEVSFGGVNITKSIQPYLLSITYTDNEEDETDDLQIKIQDRDDLWLTHWLDEISQNLSWTPPSDKQGVSSGSYSERRFAMDVVFVRENWNSDGSDAVLPCGVFELDNISCSGPPNTVCIKGSSIPFSSQLRQTCKSKAWESYTLSGIANEIAGNSGMTCMYESDSDPYYERVEQTGMSDIKFLSQLCHDAGISLKVTNQILVLFDQRKYEALPAIHTIKRYNRSYKTYQLETSAADAQYASCRVSYVNPATGQCIEGIAKADGYAANPNSQQLELTAKVETAGEAKALAEKNLRLRNKFCRQARFVLPGDTRLVAGVTVMLQGWGGYDGKYIVKQAVHRLDGSGYTTQITLRMVLEGY